MENEERKWWVGAFLNQNFLEVHTESGYGLITGDHEKGKSFILSPDCINEELGVAVQQALDASRIVRQAENPEFYISIEERYKKWMSAMMQRFKYKTKSAMFRKMLSCSIIRHKESITIEPSNHKRSDYWNAEGITEDDHVILPDTSTPEEIGAGLRLAFSRCRGLGTS